MLNKERTKKRSVLRSFQPCSQVEMLPRPQSLPQPQLEEKYFLKESKQDGEENESFDKSSEANVSML